MLDQTTPGNLNHSWHFRVWLHDCVQSWLPLMAEGQKTFASGNVHSQLSIVTLKFSINMCSHIGFGLKK